MGYNAAPPGWWQSFMGARHAEAYGRRNAVPPEMVVRLHVQHVAAKVDVAD